MLPSLIVGMQGGDTASAARIYGLFGVAWAAMQFVFSPIAGALSDRFGRRPIIISSNLGLGFDYIKRTVNDPLCNRLLSVEHEVVHELRQNAVAILGVRQNFALFGGVTTGHL